MKTAAFMVLSLLYLVSGRLLEDELPEKEIFKPLKEEVILVEKQVTPVVRQETGMWMMDTYDKKQLEEEVVTVKEGSPVTLVCSSSSPWFLCAWTGAWTGLERRRLCLLQEGPAAHVRRVCGAAAAGGELDTGARLEGGGRHCRLGLGLVTLQHTGHYLCLLSEGEQLNTVRRAVRLEVASPAHLQVFMGGKELLGDLVQVEEGDQIHLECRTNKVMPVPSLSWTGPWQEVLEGSVIQFTAHRSFNELPIICHSQQGELYSSESSPVLVWVVQSSPSPLSSSLSQSFPLLHILPFLGFLLFLSSILVFFLYRTHTKRRGVCVSSTGYWTQGLSPVLASTPSQQPVPVLDGNFVSFFPVDLYGGGDSVLEPRESLHTAHFEMSQSPSPTHMGEQSRINIKFDNSPQSDCTFLPTDSNYADSSLHTDNSLHTDRSLHSDSSLHFDSSLHTDSSLYTAGSLHTEGSLHPDGSLHTNSTLHTDINSCHSGNYCHDSRCIFIS